MTYRYKATRHDGRPTCEFTLFSEVGEPYQPLFAAFFKRYDVKGTIEYDAHPYLADHLKRP